MSNRDINLDCSDNNFKDTEKKISLCLETENSKVEMGNYFLADFL